MLDNIKEEKLIGANKEKYQIQVDEPEEEKSVVVLTGKSTKRGQSIDTELSDKSPDHKYDIKHKGQKDKKFVSFKESGSITSLRTSDPKKLKQLSNPFMRKVTMIEVGFTPIDQGSCNCLAFLFNSYICNSFYIIIIILTIPLLVWTILDYQTIENNYAVHIGEIVLNLLIILDIILRICYIGICQFFNSVTNVIEALMLIPCLGSIALIVFYHYEYQEISNQVLIIAFAFTQVIRITMFFINRKDSQDMKETEINLESIKSLELMKHQPTFNEVMEVSLKGVSQDADIVSGMYSFKDSENII